MASATPSSDARYDVWMVGARDPGGAIDVLTDVLGDRQRAREAVLSMPTFLVHGVSSPDVEQLRSRLAPHGVELEARPSRRAALTPVHPAPNPAPTAAVTSPPAPGSAASEDAATELGEAKVSYHAALVAAPAYVLQPSALFTIVVLTVLTLLSSFGALTGSIVVAFGAPLMVSGLRFSIFALIVRRSHAGQTDLRLGDDELDPFGVLFAGVRFVFVTLTAFGPFILVGWSMVPKVVTFFMVGDSGVSTGEFVLTLLLLAVTFLLPLVALPGAYAATALGTGCSGINPLVGLLVARRIPGPYFLTLVYLTAFWFASVALTSGGALAAFSSMVDDSEGVAGMLFTMVVFTGLMTLMEVTSMLISARVLGLLTYHYREELGL